MQRAGYILYLLLRLAIIATLLGGLVWGWYLLKDPQNFPLRQVKITGTFQHVDKKILHAVVLPYANQGFFELNVSQLEKSLQQLAWIDDVAIRRVWPDTITIDVQEQKAIAVFGSNELINPYGKVFSAPITSFPSGLPKLNANPTQESLAWQYYQQLGDILRPRHLQITELELNARQAVSLILNNGISVLLGRDNIIPRLQRFVAVYPRLFASQAANVANVDLRYDNGFAVLWKSKFLGSSH